MRIKLFFSLKFNALYSIFFLGLLLTSSGCFRIRAGTEKSGKKLFETFYAGEEGTQYFIKPLYFTDKSNQEKINIDFTFREKAKGNVIFNFTIESKEIIKNIDTLTISNNFSETKVSVIQLLFNEKRKDYFLSRFTANMPIDSLKKLFKSNDWRLTLNYSQISKSFKPSKKTNKNIIILRDNIFVLL